MGLAKRIIPCLDVDNGRVVKGVKFVEIRDAGDPVELGALYAQQGADELVFLDITATVDDRKTLVNLVREVARHVNIPFTVGGGISSISDVSALLNAGADKVSINSSAVRRPELVDELALAFGSQCIIVAIDTRFEPAAGLDFVHTHGGRRITELKTLEWAREVENRGAGEILLTSMDADGTKAGFACDLTAKVSSAASIPIIASGGAGTMEHFTEVFTSGKADAGLAASIFHFKEIEILALKNYLASQGIPMRI
jgi:cyclase